MIFMFHEEAGAPLVHLRKEEYKYLIKVRRHKTGDTIALRNVAHPEILYTYTLTAITPKEARLELLQKRTHIVAAKKKAAYRLVCY